jgi:hypothetical protein
MALGAALWSVSPIAASAVVSLAVELGPLIMRGSTPVWVPEKLWFYPRCSDSCNRGFAFAVIYSGFHRFLLEP